MTNNKKQTHLNFPSPPLCQRELQACMNGKILIERGARTVLNTKNAAFQHKRLCDGIVANFGDSCGFSCTYCYVGAQMRKIVKPFLVKTMGDNPLPEFEDIVIRRHDAALLLQRQLLRSDGSALFDDPADRRVVFLSSLVDPAANNTLLKETAACINLIMKHTNWQVRGLSKSAALARLVTEELVPAEFHHRLILGLSIGTLDDRVARAMEVGASSPSARIKALHQLQDLGIRTFGMICPSLPQEDYTLFSRGVCEAIRADKCEHVWGEVINLRGNSFTRTIGALRDAGLKAEATRLETVCGPCRGSAWEDYARETFLAHTRHVPAEKLRFLQYVTAKSVDWWAARFNDGAVLLGRIAAARGLIAVVPSPSLILSHVPNS